MKLNTKMILLALLAGSVASSSLDAASKRGRGYDFSDDEGDTYATHPYGDDYNSEDDYSHSEDEEGSRQQQKHRNPAGTESTPVDTSAMHEDDHAEAGPAGAGTGAGAGFDDGTGGGSSMALGASAAAHAAGAASGTVGTALLRPHPIPAKPAPGIVGFLINRQAGWHIRGVSRVAEDSLAHAYKIIQERFLSDNAATRAAALKTYNEIIAREQRPYLVALTAARAALPAGTILAHAQAAFDELDHENHVLRLAYQFVWTMHPDNPGRINLNQEPTATNPTPIDMSTTCYFNNGSLRLNFASLTTELQQQLLIHLACASNNITNITMVNILPHTKPLQIFAPHLTRLFMRNNPHINSNDHLLAPKLIFLDATNCTGLTTIPVLPNLQTLRVTNSTALTTIPVLLNLQTLVVGNCTALTAIAALPNLQVLGAENCTALTTIPVLPNLQIFSYTNCTSIIERGSLPRLYDLKRLDDFIATNRARITREQSASTLGGGGSGSAGGAGASATHDDLSDSGTCIIS